MEQERYYTYMLRRMREEDAKMTSLKKSDTKIWVTFQKEGLHKYPAALDRSNFITGSKWDARPDISAMDSPQIRSGIPNLTAICSGKDPTPE